MPYVWLVFRVLFGSTNLFVFHHPQDLEKQQADGEVVQVPSYESAQEEIATNSALWNITGKDEFRGDVVLVLVMSNA